MEIPQITSPNIDIGEIEIPNVTTVTDNYTSIPLPPSNVIVSKLPSATTILLPSVSLPKANGCGTTESIVIFSAFTEQ